MRFPTLAAMSPFGFVLLLAACASLSEEQCRAGDWRGIGFVDGTAGRDTDYIANHQKACAEIGVTPDLTAWLDGRQQGLQTYCTPEKAYQVGRSGRALSPVCPAASRASMDEAHYAGRQYYEIRQEIDRLRSDRFTVEAALDDLPDDAGADRRRLRNERSRIDRRISGLEQDQRRYESWRY